MSYIKISVKQAGYSAAAFIMTSALLTKGIYMYLRQDSWMAVILGFLVSLLFVFIYSALNKRFPSKNLMEINEIVFGKIAGWIVSALYLFYFFSLIILNLRDISGFIRLILPSTPSELVMVLFIYLCSWAVKKGAFNITSYGPLILIISLTIIILNAFFLYKDIEFNRLIPVMTFPPEKYLAGSHLVAALQLCEIFSFYMMVPYMKKTDGLGGALLRGLVIGAAVLIFIVCRDILVLGDMVLIFSMPTYTVIRLINVGDILTRVEILYAVMLISVMFLKISVLYFATVAAAGKLLGSGSHDYLIKITGALSVIFAISAFSAGYEHNEWTDRAAPLYSTVFVMFLPALTLVTAAIRRLDKRKA